MIFQITKKNHLSAIKWYLLAKKYHFYDLGYFAATEL